MRGCCCLFVSFGQKWGNRIRLALSLIQTILIILLCLFFSTRQNKKAMAARISRLAPALANLRAGASLARHGTAFRSFATEAGNNSVRVSSHALSLTHAEYMLIF
jgi:hypothetical protein